MTVTVTVIQAAAAAAAGPGPAGSGGGPRAVTAGHLAWSESRPATLAAWARPGTAEQPGTVRMPSSAAVTPNRREWPSCGAVVKFMIFGS